MSLRSLLLLLVGIAILVFTGANWSVMMEPTRLSLIVTEVDAPLGLIMLGLLAGVSCIFVLMIAYIQGTVLVETRRHARELAAQRDLADKAEASRFTDLRAHLDQEMSRLNETLEKVSQETISRVDRAEMGLREHSSQPQLDKLAQTVEEFNRELHMRIDRLEMGLGDRIAHKQTPVLQAPAPVSMPTHSAGDAYVDVDDATPH